MRTVSVGVAFCLPISAVSRCCVPPNPGSRPSNLGRKRAGRKAEGAGGAAKSFGAHGIDSETVSWRRHVVPLRHGSLLAVGLHARIFCDTWTLHENPQARTSGASKADAVSAPRCSKRCRAAPQRRARTSDCMHAPPLHASDLSVLFSFLRVARRHSFRWNAPRLWAIHAGDADCKDADRSYIVLHRPRPPCPRTRTEVRRQAHPCATPSMFVFASRRAEPVAESRLQ